MARHARIGLADEHSCLLRCGLTTDAIPMYKPRDQLCLNLSYSNVGDSGLVDIWNIGIIMPRVNVSKMVFGILIIMILRDWYAAINWNVPFWGCKKS